MSSAGARNGDLRVGHLLLPARHSLGEGGDLLRRHASHGVRQGGLARPSQSWRSADTFQDDAGRHEPLPQQHLEVIKILRSPCRQLAHRRVGWLETKPAKTVGVRVARASWGCSSGLGEGHLAGFLKGPPALLRGEYGTER